MIEAKRRKEIDKQLFKIQELTENGHTKLVKEILKRNHASYSSLRNWLKDPEKAYRSYDIKKGVLQKISDELPQYSNMLQSHVYEFLLEESGSDRNEQRAIQSYVGSYKIFSTLPKEFKIGGMMVRYNNAANYPYFVFSLRYLDRFGTSQRIKSDGFVFVNGEVISFSGVQKKLDAVMYARRPFNVDEMPFEGTLILNIKEIGKVITGKIVLVKLENNAVVFEKKETDALRILGEEDFYSI